jgi:large subunit ribosomal protein L32
MPNPKKKHTRSRSGKRRSHQALTAPSLARCRQCQQPIPPHTVCSNCGTYSGRRLRRVLVTEED